MNQSNKQITANDEKNNQDNSESAIITSENNNNPETTNQDNEEKLIALLKQFIVIIIKSLRFSLVLLWSTAPKATAFVVIVLLLQSLIPAITVGIQKQVVDTVASLVPGGEYDWKIIAILVLLWVAALFLDNLLSPWVNIAFMKLSDRLMVKIGRAHV